MSGDDSIVSPVNVSAWWLILGILLFVFMLLWIGFVLWLTRARESQTLAHAPMREPHMVNSDEIKLRYLTMLEEIRASYHAQEVTARIAHQKVSYCARCFACEISGRSAYTFTLTDLEQANLPTLKDLISGIYPAEFAKLSQGDVDQAVDQAREMVRSW